MKNFKYVVPASVEEAGKLGQEPGTVYLGGGTDLLGVLKDRLTPSYPEKVINLKALEMNAIEVKEDGLHVGAGATLTQIATSPVVKEGWNALADAAYSIATPNLRNTATLGGNICQDIRCWYYRYPDILGGAINCARKEGHLCSAMMGENRYHSIFGAAKVCETPCTGHCPAHTDISAYMARLRAGDVDGAARILMEVNPMPAITGRVCPHYCQEECNRNTYDENVNINAVERYLGDYVLENADRFMKAPAAENGKHVAIIGSGPAGLTAAYYLREAGYAVTVYEKQKEAGGCLIYAIPAYRLPKEIVRDFIGKVEAMGVTIKCGVNVGKDITLEQLKNENDSVLVDTGTWGRPLIGIKDEELTHFGLDFLVDVNTYIQDGKPGSKVVVVGGGNVAMDVAICAKRLGAQDVKMVCLEQRDDMPANKEEIECALEEGIEILNGWGPKNILKNDGAVCGVEFKACPQVRDAEGRFAPVYDEDNVITVEADVILMAVGQKADLEVVEGACKVETERGRIKTTDGVRTNVEGIFAAGDIATGPATVVSAMATGKKAAIEINAYCIGDSLPVEKATSARVNNELLSFDNACRHCGSSAKQDMVEPEKRELNKEDKAGLTLEQTCKEAGRCFNCGCLAVNPSDMANMLYAYGAKVVTNLRTLEAKEFFAAHTQVAKVLEKGEFVTEVIVPKLPEGAHARYDKFRLRKSIDFAVVAVASICREEEGKVKDVSLVMGAVAPIPMKAEKAEAYLIGKKLDAETAAKAAEIALEGAIPLENNTYKIDLAKVMIRRALGF